MRTKLLKRPASLVVVAAMMAGATLGGVLLANGPAAASGPAPATHATIEVTGNGEVTGTPDMLSVQMAVSTKAGSAIGALDQNNAEVMKLEAELTRAGVKSADLQTNNLDVSPNYDSDGTITSYRTEDDLTVTLRDIAQSGTVIDGAAHSVGNDVQIQAISLSISHTSSLLKAARIQAMLNAEAQASDLASGAGASLGPVVRITDQEQTTTPPPREFFSASLNAAAAKSAVPVQPGSEQVSVEVDVTYELGG